MTDGREIVFIPTHDLYVSPKDLIGVGLKKYDIIHVCIAGFKPDPHSTHQRTGLPILHWEIILHCKPLNQEKQEHHTSSDKHGKSIYIHVDHSPTRPEGFPPDRKDLPIFVEIYESDTAFPPDTPAETRFIFPISKEAQKGLTGHALIDLFDKFKYSKYRYPIKAQGVCIGKSEKTREELEKLDKITSGMVIGGKYYVSGGVGKFEKEHSEPNLKLQD